MATARVSHKRSYDDFMAPYGDYGYNAHAGRNVQTLRTETMDTMDEAVPVTKRSKFALHDEAAQTSQPSTQANLIAHALQTLPQLTTAEDLLNPQTWLKALPRSRRHHHELIGTIGCIGRNDSVFSLEDVNNILSASLKAQEERLHHQFQAILNERMSELARSYEEEKEAEIRAQNRPFDSSFYS